VTRNSAQREQHRRAIKRNKPPCHLCGQPIDYTLGHLDPMAYVVDHVVPLARGGPDTLDNKAAAHRKCNRDKSDHMPRTEGRRVVLICGPPGSGKTTLAHSLGLTVYDSDDAQWHGSERLFRDAITHVGRDQQAQAAVIRSAATETARSKAARMCGATEVRVLDVDLATCTARIKARGTTNRSVRELIAGAQDWWKNYEPTIDILSGAPRSFVTARTW
jgi:hypothetical protein